jgi:hypothetical protein
VSNSKKVYFIHPFSFNMVVSSIEYYMMQVKKYYTGNNVCSCAQIKNSRGAHVKKKE